MMLARLPSCTAHDVDRVLTREGFVVRTSGEATGTTRARSRDDRHVGADASWRSQSELYSRKF